MASSEILVYVFPLLITLCSYLIVSGGSQHLSNTAKSSLDEGLKKHLITPFYSPSNVSLKITWLEEVRLITYVVI